MLFCSNKSIPIGLLLTIAMLNAWHLKGVYKYHKHERPLDRWDFKVWDLRSPIRVPDPAGLASQHWTAATTALLGWARRNESDHKDGWGANQTTTTTNMRANALDEPISNSNNNSNKDDDEAATDDAPYLYKNYLHQPLSKKNSPRKIYAHVICGSVPIFTGAANLLDFLRTTPATSASAGAASTTHRIHGYLFFVFGMITAVQGTILAPHMRFSHCRTVLCTCVALLGIATAACIAGSVHFLRAAIAIRKHTTHDADDADAEQQVLRRAMIVGHRVWALRAWLLMEFFLLWARVLMGAHFFVTGHKHSFVIGGIAALVTVPVLLEWGVRWHLVRTNEGDKYRLLGPLPWASHDELRRLERTSSFPPPARASDPKRKFD